jgi:hypothetical protein
MMQPSHQAENTHPDRVTVCTDPSVDNYITRLGVFIPFIKHLESPVGVELMTDDTKTNHLLSRHRSGHTKVPC